MKERERKERICKKDKGRKDMQERERKERIFKKERGKNNENA
jgi:hypothetical protein